MKSRLFVTIEFFYEGRDRIPSFEKGGGWFDQNVGQVRMFQAIGKAFFLGKRPTVISKLENVREKMKKELPLVEEKLRSVSERKKEADKEFQAVIKFIQRQNACHKEP